MDMASDTVIDILEDTEVGILVDRMVDNKDGTLVHRQVVCRYHTTISPGTWCCNRPAT